MANVNEATLKEINHLRGKYIKAVLGKLEAVGEVDEYTRKAILDGINDLVRDVHRTLGVRLPE